jgi:hypothetical protein
MGGGHGVIAAQTRSISRVPHVAQSHDYNAVHHDMGRAGIRMSAVDQP